MPIAPMRACATAGCPVRVARGHCPQHARPIVARVQQRADDQRTNSHQRGYTRRWSQQRTRFLRDHPLCGMRAGGRPPVMSVCAAEGRTTAGTHVDHVVPHRGDRALFDDPENWQTLCAACHSRKTASGA
jgi:5-methylcytosine-specific restriction protein A